MKKTMTIQEAVEAADKDPLWVCNITDGAERAEYRPADLYFTVKDGNDAISMEVPQTWLPQLLTEQAPRSIILRSKGFLDALRNGLVEILTPAYADKLNSDPQAQTERDRLINNQRKVRNVVNEQQKRVSDQMKTLDTDKLTEVGSDGDDAFRARVVAINNMDLEEAKVQIRKTRRISIAKLEYLIANLKHRSLAAFLKKQLEKAEEA